MPENILEALAQLQRLSQQPQQEQTPDYDTIESLLKQRQADLADATQRRKTAVDMLYTSPQEIARQKYKDMLDFGSTKDEATGGRRKKSKTEKAKTVVNWLGTLGAAVSPDRRDDVYDRILGREMANYNSVVPNVRADVTDLRLREDALQRQMLGLEGMKSRAGQIRNSSFHKMIDELLKAGKLDAQTARDAKQLEIAGRRADAEVLLKGSQSGLADARAGMVGQQTKNLAATGGATGDMGSASALTAMDPQKRQDAMDLYKGMQTAKGAGRAAGRGPGGSQRPRSVQMSGDFVDPETGKITQGTYIDWLQPGQAGFVTGPQGLAKLGEKESTQQKAFKSAQGSVREAAQSLSQAVRSKKVGSMLGPTGALKYEVFKHFPGMGDLNPADFTNAQSTVTAISNGLFKHATAQGIRQAGLINGMKAYFPPAKTDQQAIAGALAAYYGLMEITQVMGNNKELVDKSSDYAIEQIMRHYGQQAQKIANGGEFKPLGYESALKILRETSPKTISTDDMRKGAAEAAAEKAPAQRTLKNFLSGK